VPSGDKLMSLQHPEDRVDTVTSGVFYIGLGSRFDEGQLQAYPPGAVIMLPGGTPISTGQSPILASPRCRPPGRLVLNTSTRLTTRGTSEDAFSRRQ
jgi:hypothetical protein